MKKSRNKSSGGTFVKRELYKSKAFLALGSAAPQVLILFLDKRQMRLVKHGKKQDWICTNSDTISFTYIEAVEKYGFTKSRFSRAIGDFLKKGFISIKHRGGAYKRDKSIYALSDKWRSWRPGTVFEERKRERVQRGFCKPKRANSTSKIVPLHSNECEPKRMVLEQ